MDTDLLRQLNDDVWRPFRLAYAGLDAPAFLDLYSAELIRAGGPAKQVIGFPTTRTRRRSGSPSSLTAAAR